MKEIVSLKDVCFSYSGNISALKGINLSVNEGELVSIIGQNGSGKSTLLNIINALIFPDSGEVFFKGLPVNKQTINEKQFRLYFRSKMGYIFQNPEIQLFCQTVFDELMFGPLQLNIPYEEAKERILETLSALNIEYLQDRSVIMLSGGEKKKVAIASVLTMNPNLLLIDEPLAGLDPKTQTFFIELILQLNKAGKTIIFSTHHLDLIDHLQPKVVAISEDHSVLRIAPANEILNDESFLINANLIHEHIHKHGEEIHKHYHSHYVFHKH